MGWFSRLFKAEVQSGQASVKASYDAAKTTTSNERHWANTDSLSAKAATNKAVRKKLRERARYEVANNSYARGIIDTIANDTIGTGPHLQMNTGSDDFDNLTEELFKEWAREIGLREKLITGRKARLESGEVFFVFVTNEKLKSPIKLDIKVVESDQVTDDDEFSFSLSDDDNADGIKFDENENPVSYNILKSHPGSNNIQSVTKGERVDADEVVHMFRVDRPGQPRGVPECSAALSLFAIMRRYTLAVVEAAETAANNAYTIFTQHANLDADAIEMDVAPFETVDMERNMATVIPAGWRAEQMKAEQPTDTYPDFKKEIINEVARCMSVPFNIAAGNSSTYNYASGRLDHQGYFKNIGIEQSNISDTILFRMFEKWMAEAIRVGVFDGIVALPAIDTNDVHKKKQWFWDSKGQQDPLRESKAQVERLNNNLTTLAIECAKDGTDWKEVIIQRGREMRLMVDEGLIDPLTLKRLEAEERGGDPDDYLLNDVG